MELFAINLNVAALDFCFHPHLPVIVTASIAGALRGFNYKDRNVKKIFFLKPHTKACRSVKFDTGGNLLYSVSRDKSIKCVDFLTEKIITDIPKAHNTAINALEIIDMNTLITGDEDGIIKLWDIKEKKEIKQFKNNFDFISCFATVPDTKTVLAGSGDGMLTVINVRRLMAKSGYVADKDEILSLTFVDHNQKVILGTQKGSLNILGNRGGVDDFIDNILGHPCSVDTLCSLNDHIFFSGSVDGIIRVLSAKNKSFLGVWGDHGEYPIEQIRISPDKRLLVSCSHDETVKFWDLEIFYSEYNRDKAISSTDENFSNHLGLEKTQKDCRPEIMPSEMPPKKKKRNVSMENEKRKQFFADL